MDTDGKTTAGDFICDADIYEMKNSILRLQQEVPFFTGQNTDAINGLENRTNNTESDINDLGNDILNLQGELNTAKAKIESLETDLSEKVTSQTHTRTSLKIYPTSHGSFQATNIPLNLGLHNFQSVTYEIDFLPEDVYYTDNVLPDTSYREYKSWVFNENNDIDLILRNNTRTILEDHSLGGYIITDKIVCNFQGGDSVKDCDIIFINSNPNSSQSLVWRINAAPIPEGYYSFEYTTNTLVRITTN